MRQEPDKVDWVRCIPFIILHLGCLGVIWVGVSAFAAWVLDDLALGLPLEHFEPGSAARSGTPQAPSRERRGGVHLRRDPGAFNLNVGLALGSTRVLLGVLRLKSLVHRVEAPSH